MKLSKLEILLIEDNMSEADLIMEMLLEVGQPEFSVQHVQRLAEGLSLLKTRSFDLVLVDLGLPDSQGLETALTVREQSKRIPIVALTSLDDEETALKSLQMDIQDYLIKGEIAASLLSRAIRYAIQRKRDAESLRVAQLELQLVTDTMTTGVIRCSSDLRFLWVNPAYARWLRRSPEEIIGHSIGEILGAGAFEAVLPYVERVLTGQQVQYEAKVDFGGEGPVWISGIHTPTFDSAGVPDGWVAVITDITEQKNAQQEIERLHADLSGRAAELESANLELEAFNYSAAHDLRQPLNLISGYCQVIKMLCGEQMPVKCLDYVDQTYKSALRMNGLIHALLNFSRLSRAEPHRETISLSSMAHEVAAMLKQAEPERKVDFRIAEGIEADVDADLLRVVLDNLLGNAWKYTGKRDEAVIEFGLTQIGARAAYFVRDNGGGFAMADADKLFIPFQRLSGAENFRGFGIGLATVERIIRRHGGTIWAEGEPGKGATFYFSLAC
jgi:PAS domain S-box-containing protein